MQSEVCLTADPGSQRKRENDHRNDFMINFHGSHVAELGFELSSNPSSAT